MNRNEIMQLAQKAGFNTDHNMISVEGWEIFPYMQRFADLVAAAEREACADICEGHYATDMAARAIRARGEV